MQLDSAAHAERILSDAQARLRAVQADSEAARRLRHDAAAAHDYLHQRGIQLAADAVDQLLLRPPWLGQEHASCSDWDVARSRAALVARLPKAASLLAWIDARRDAMEPYRRLSYARHLPWSEQAVEAAVSAVQRARARLGPGAPPRVLVAPGSLGSEAAAAAAAGARVTACEPNRFAAAAIRAVAVAHGVGHAVRVLEVTVEQLCAEEADAERGVWDVAILSPLLEEAALGGRILPAAAAVSAAAAAAGHAGLELVPARVVVRGALAVLSAGVVHGVDLTPLDSTRWTPYPLAWSAEGDEGGRLLTRFEPVLTLTLDADGSGGAANDWRDSDSSVSFTARPEYARAARGVTGAEGEGGGGPAWIRCNALLLDTCPEFRLDAPPVAARLPTMRRGAVFFPPFALETGERAGPPRPCAVRVSHDGLRIAASPSAVRRLPLPGPGWGRLLLQHWHFAMLRDAPRNEAYAAALPAPSLNLP